MDEKENRKLYDLGVEDYNTLREAMRAFLG